jgi:hypothetical protein
MSFLHQLLSFRNPANKAIKPGWSVLGLLKVAPFNKAYHLPICDCSFFLSQWKVDENSDDNPDDKEFE